jgi:hypothetical protein
MLHYACLFMQNSCKLYTYSGKFPSLKRLYSGYGGKFLQEHPFPPRHFLPKLYPPLCQVSCTKNWTKLFRFLVCEIRRLGICYKAPPLQELGGTPHGLREETMNSRNIFRKKSMLGRSFMYLCRYYVCRYVCCTML